MITSLIVIAVCVALVAVAIALVECPGYKDGGARDFASTVLSWLSLGLFGNLLLILMVCNLGVDGTYEDHVEQREFLVHVLETRGYSEYEKEDFFDEIREFNFFVRQAESRAESPWYNWFVDKSWLGVEPIETDDYLFTIGQMN